MLQADAQDTIGNLSYTIENKSVFLVDGAASQSVVPESSSRVTTQLYRHEIFDVNGDKRDDAVVILLQQSVGSGSFYYVSVALQLDEGFRTLDAKLLGDRIKPTRITRDAPRFVVEYMDREPGQPMSNPPGLLVRQAFMVDADDQEIVIIARDLARE